MAKNALAHELKKVFFLKVLHLAEEVLIKKTSVKNVTGFIERNGEAIDFLTRELNKRFGLSPFLINKLVQLVHDSGNVDVDVLNERVFELVESHGHPVVNEGEKHKDAIARIDGTTPTPEAAPAVAEEVAPEVEEVIAPTPEAAPETPTKKSK